MKNIKIYVLITILVIFQGLSFQKINSLQNQLEYTKSNLNNLNNQLSNDISQIYTDVDEMLKQEESLIESATTDIGTINEDELTVPIIFTITPKEVSEYTAVSIDFDGELHPMKKDDTIFSATISCYIFGNTFPNILIDEGGIKKTTQDERFGVSNIKEMLFPSMYLILDGESSYDGKTYKRKGELVSETKEVLLEMKYTQMSFVIKVDDVVISDEIISTEMLFNGWQVDEAIPLKKGQICTMTVIATDSLGLKHHFQVDNWVADAESQLEVVFDNEKIYSADGKLLWEPEYIK